MDAYNEQLDAAHVLTAAPTPFAHLVNYFTGRAVCGLRWVRTTHDARTRAQRDAQLALPLCPDCAIEVMFDDDTDYVARECGVGDGCTQPQEYGASIDYGCAMHGMDAHDWREHHQLAAAGY